MSFLLVLGFFHSHQSRWHFSVPGCILQLGYLYSDSYIGSITLLLILDALHRTISLSPGPKLSCSGVDSGYAPTSPLTIELNPVY